MKIKTNKYRINFSYKRYRRGILTLMLTRKSFDYADKVLISTNESYQDIFVSFSRIKNLCREKGINSYVRMKEKSNISNTTSDCANKGFLILTYLIVLALLKR